ncbi:MAG: aminoglycoside phosphotransferase [Actinobacteria bacterium HGW-Actinobacteria-4]|nr:MAG: aminoglycoside phosphotransferase [Actinobacteria bacterium HGW-Actinobacteria-4]
MDQRPNGGPLAFNTMRLTWPDLPHRVRDRVADLAGAEVVNARGTTTGFGPGFAGIVDLANGTRVFVKATGEHEHPWSIGLARAELRANAALPETVPAPRLLWSDQGAWTLAGFECLEGASPSLPWSTSDLGRVFDALTDLARTPLTPGHALIPIVTSDTEFFTVWESFAKRPKQERLAAAARGGRWGEWALRHVDTFVAWECEAAAACAGGALVHGDLRADNVVIDTCGKAWMVDWPHATVGAPWLDLAFFLPSVEMQGGGSALEHFRSHPLGVSVGHRELRAVVTVLTGYFMLSSWQDAPEQIPRLREFQAAQAIPAARWLQALEPELAG